MLKSKNTFKVLGHISVEEAKLYVDNCINSNHYQHRNKRTATLNDEARIIDGMCAIVDKKHIDGLEVHIMFSDGSIRIYNYMTRKRITILWARPEQVRRIMDLNIYPKRYIPDYLFRVIRKNLKQKKNKI